MLDNWKKRAAAGFLALSLIAVPTLTQAATLQEVLEQQQNTKRQIENLEGTKDNTLQQIDQKLGELSELHAQQANLNAELERLDGEIATSQETLANIQQQIEELTASIVQTQKDIEALEKSIAEKKETFKGRLQIMYKNGDVGALEVLLSADGISDFLSRSKMMQSLAQYDRDLITSLVNDMNALNTKKNELNGQKAAVEIAKQNEETHLQELAAQQEEKNKLLDNVNWEAQMTAEEMESLDAQSRALESQIAENEKQLNELADQEDQIREEIAEQERIAKEKAAAEKAAAERAAAEKAAAKKTTTTARKSSSSTASTTSRRTSSSGYAWPSSSYRVSSYYGFRTHPVTGMRSSFHRGIDIAAAHGTPIYATASGTVTLARYNGTYGNCVKLSHVGGGGSLYGHMSRIAVSAGQHVERGQIIGYIGSTGRSTGPHLHFELYRGNTLVNPLGYL